MANNITPKLKAYVQTDSTGRVVSGTPVFRTSKPKSGTWREIPMYYRGSNPSTTTTTTSGGGGGVTAWVVKSFISSADACAGNTPYGPYIAYTQGNTLTEFITLWADAALTVPYTYNIPDRAWITTADSNPSKTYYLYYSGTQTTINFILNC